MQIAARPHLAAGVALVGASLIAVTPVTPSAPPVHLPYALTAAIENPDTVFAPVGDQVQSFIEGIVDRIAANPAPLPRQLLVTALNNTEVFLNDPFNVTDQFVVDLQNAIHNFGPSLATFGETTSAAGDALSAGLGELVGGLPAALEAASPLFEAGDINGAIDSIVSSGMMPLLGIITNAVMPEINAVGHLFNVPQPLIDATTETALSSIIGLASATIGIGYSLDGIPKPLVQQAIAGTQEIVSSVLSANPVNLVNALQHSTAGMLESITYQAHTAFDMLNYAEDQYAKAFKAITPPRPLKVPSALAALTAAPEATVKDASVTKALKASESSDAADTTTDDDAATTATKATTKATTKAAAADSSATTDDATTDAKPAVTKDRKSLRHHLRSTIGKVTGTKKTDAAAGSDATKTDTKTDTKKDAHKTSHRGAHAASHKGSGKSAGKGSHRGSGKHSRHK